MFLYVLTFNNGKKYIGKSTSPTRRLRDHRIDMQRGSRMLVYQGWKKHGEPQLTVLAQVEPHMIDDMERRAIVAFKTMHPFGYNTAPGGTGGRVRAVYVFTPAHRAAISAAKRGIPGRKQSAELVEKRISKLRGRKRPDISAMQRGKKHSPEWCAHMSAGIRAAKRSKKPHSGDVTAVYTLVRDAGKTRLEVV